ncbi:GNAT family N-acyltransferase [Vannielia sp.]|uniref:GNAT family N-acetyltransferase n=1 Tax=Vannielia sp. TaxID=2813045 RepID=UPI0026396654|nr:GNAT family N-acyltransferase [Vannielia sp.]MDF1872587.1 GNAT family N-acetyltransferase [Vannielia sp.]
MATGTPDFELRLARNEADLTAVQRLRYDVFVGELGGDGPLVDHNARLERDRYDARCDHLMLVDKTAGAVVGVYRLLPGAVAMAGDGFYSEGEYDLTPLISSGRKLLELGRSCLAPDYRGGMAMFRLWGGLWDYVEARGIEVLFGTASFHGTDVDALKTPLAYLHHHHLAPEALRPKARPPEATTMDLMPAPEIDRVAAMKATPALIKAYLRLGGWVGEGAWVDRDFNTTDVCLVLDANHVNPRQVAIYKGERAQ